MDNQQLSSNIKWRTIKDYDHYEVNNLGQVRHKVRRKILKPRANKGNYFYVNFKINGCNKNLQCIGQLQKPLSRIQTIFQKLIIKIMIQPTTELKTQNGVIVLIIHFILIKKRKNKEVRGKIVSQFDLKGNFIKNYKTLRQAANENNLNLGGISNCCHGRTKSSGGYIWEFTESSTTKYQRNPS